MHKATVLLYNLEADLLQLIYSFARNSSHMAFQLFFKVQRTLRVLLSFHSRYEKNFLKFEAWMIVKKARLIAFPD